MLDPNTFKIGDTVHYIEPYGNPLYPQSGIIAGETPRSWILIELNSWLRLAKAEDWLASEIKRRGRKIPKNGKGYRFFTSQEAEDARWLVDNRYAVSRIVEHVAEASILLQIAKLLRYEKLPKTEVQSD